MILCFAYFTLSGHGDMGHVVSFGTGESVATSNVITIDGRVVLDCHSLTVAKRALVK